MTEKALKEFVKAASAFIRAHRAEGDNTEFEGWELERTLQEAIEAVVKDSLDREFQRGDYDPEQ